MVQTRSAAKRVNFISDIASTHRTESTRDEDATAGLGVLGVQQRSKHVNARRNGTQTQPTSRRQSMRGKLSMLPDINLDVLSQILSYLLPMDLLNLARLTRPFRQFLMSKARTFLWVAARKQVDGLPDCPPDMSEPEYANLVFDIHCHSCGGVVYTIYWAIRRRYCPGCRAKRLRLAEGCNGLPDTLGMLPSEYLQGIIELRGGMSFVDKQQYDAVYKEYLKTPIGKRNAFIDRRQKIVADRETQADECMGWHLTVSYNRKHKLSEARKESIFARLENAGYAREIQYFGKDYIVMSHCPVFRLSKRLTKKAMILYWEEVNSILEISMIEWRDERFGEVIIRPRRSLLIKMYDRYIQDPAPEGRAVYLLPSVWDVAGFAPFEAIINLPEDQLVDETTFIPALDQLPALTRQWREEVDAQIASIVRIGTGPSRRASTYRQKRPDVPSKELLQLACAVFEVRGCTRDLFTYPHILIESSVFYEPYGTMFNRASRPWSLPKEGFKSVQLFTDASDVVAICGLDPRVATVDDMDQASARLICNECRESSPTSVEIFDWKSAIYHAYRHHLVKVGLPGERWTLVDKNLVPLVEAEERCCIPQHSTSLAYCALCQPRALATKYKLVDDDSGSRHHPLSDHLSQAHGIQEIEGPLQENIHYVALGGLVSRRPVRMITEGGVVSFSHS